MLLISEKLCGRKAYMGMFTKILYGAAILGLMISFVKDREKTKLVLKKAWRSLENILPSILAILLLIGFILPFLDAQAISKLLGTDSGAVGMIIAAAIGCPSPVEHHLRRPGPPDGMISTPCPLLKSKA